MGSRGGIDALVYLLDEAFGGRGIEESNESQALLPNLATVPQETWRALPDGAARSIEAIVVHVGALHAGEINHIRSLLDGDDRWRPIQMGF